MRVNGCSWPLAIDQDDEDAGSRGMKRLRLAQFIIPLSQDKLIHNLANLAQKVANLFRIRNVLDIYIPHGNFHI